MLCPYEVHSSRDNEPRLSAFGYNHSPQLPRQHRLQLQHRFSYSYADQLPVGVARSIEEKTSTINRWEPFPYIYTW